MSRLRPRGGFPYRAPTWPRAVVRPPLERRTGTDYETDWARRYGVRLARAVVLDTVGMGLARVIAAPEIHGTDRIAGLDHPAVFAANHASHVDTPLILTSLPDRFRHRTVVAAAADYFFDKRWKGAMWAFSINAIPFERTRVSPRSARLAISLVREGWNLVIYPEGGRSPHGWGQPHTAGAAFLAQRTGAPVVPVHLAGTRRILRKEGNRLTPSRTHVTFGAPLWAGPDEDPREFATRIERAVAVLADEQASDWWQARRRAATGRTPALTGPAAGVWRRAWALGEHRRAPRATTPWPNLRQ
jgi:1-acyl-sn-glycerol-3-phosphate acyltransferase